MLTVIVIVSVLVGACLVLTTPLLRRLFQRCSSEEITAEWLENFSVSAYYPMQNLLGDEDFQFLAKQPGFDLSLYRKLRRERMLIFRQYLGRLITDFNRLHTTASLVISQSTEDHSELVGRLFKLKVRFTFSVLRVECSYYSCWLGLSSLAARTVITRLEEMSAELSSLAIPAAHPA